MQRVGLVDPHIETSKPSPIAGLHARILPHQDNVVSPVTEIELMGDGHEFCVDHTADICGTACSETYLVYQEGFGCGWWAVEGLAFGVGFVEGGV